MPGQKNRHWPQICSVVAFACAALYSFLGIRKDKFTPSNEFESNQQPSDCLMPTGRDPLGVDFKEA